MADGLRVTVDASTLLAALDKMPDVLLAAAKGQAHLTAQRIAREARARVHRRTGKTAAGIQVEERRDGLGYQVVTDPDPNAGRPISLEFGHDGVAPYPFLYVSADLEAEDHDRRIRDAMQAALEGLG